MGKPLRAFLHYPEIPRQSKNEIYACPGDHDLQRVKKEYAERRKRAAGEDPYSLFFPGNLFIFHNRQREVLWVLKKEGFYPLAKKRILEVGCGNGRVLSEFLSFGADPVKLHGVDLLLWRCREAKSLNPNLPLTHSDGRFLPYLSASFDLVLQFTVFTSIHDEGIKRQLAKEMLRVVKPTGMILWYDYWLNPQNPHTKGVRPAEVRGLFPECDVSFKRITLAPPIVRRLARFSWIACEFLESLHIFNSHYLATIRPPTSKLTQAESEDVERHAFFLPKLTEKRGEEIGVNHN